MMDRKEAVEKYERAKSRGEVDEDIIPLLDFINYGSEYYTTSSCSGRIVLLQLPKIGDKLNSKFLCKCHREVEFERILDGVKKHTSGLLFFMVQSPIIHIVSPNQRAAKELMGIALACGFKYTRIKEIKENVLVEILSTENLSVPLGENGEILVSDEYIKFLVEMGNQLLKRAKEKLRCFERTLRNSPLS